MTRPKLLLHFILFLSFNVLISQSIDATLLELAFSNDGYPERFTKADNGFYFTADDDELWFTDGTKEGTRIFALPVDAYGNIDKIVPLGSKVFFDAEKNSRSDELWVSDGTEVGTIQLTSRDLSFGQDGQIRSIAAHDGKIYFSLFDELYGSELWVTDGTIGGTVLLKDINQGPDGSNPSNFFSFNGKLFFTAFTEDVNTELWSTDGTLEGTSLLLDINVGTQGSFPSKYVAYGDNFYFFANDGINGFEL